VRIKLAFSNGDLRSIILFYFFGELVLTDIIFSKKVLTTNNTSNYTLTKDIIIVSIGLLAYAIIVYFHLYIAGVVIF
jgi:hypothetical protein